MKKIIGLKELRVNMEKYTRKIKKGDSFIVMKKNVPIFKISPVEDEKWEEIIDFTKTKKGGVDIDELLKRL